MVAIAPARCPGGRCGRLLSAGKILSLTLNKHHELKNVVSVIKHNIRGTEPLFRFGGEKFVVPLDNSDCEGVVYIADGCRTRSGKAASSISGSSRRSRSALVWPFRRLHFILLQSCINFPL